MGIAAPSHLAARAQGWALLVLGALAYVAYRHATDDEPGAWWLFQGAMLAMGGAFIAWHLHAHGDDPLHPVVSMTVLLYLYATGSSLHAIRTGATYFGVPVGEDVLRPFYACCALGLLGLATGAWAAQCCVAAPTAPCDRRRGWRALDREFWPKALLYGAILALPVWAEVIAHFNPIHVRTYAETATESRRWALANPEGVFFKVLASVPAQFLLVGALVLALKKRGLLWRVPAGLAVLCYVLVPVLGGYRWEVVSVAVMGLAVYHYRVRRLGLWHFAAIVVLGYLAVTGLAIARHGKDPADMLRLLAEGSTASESRAFRLDRSSELWTAQNLMAHLHYVDEGRTTFTYGASLWTEVQLLAPRAILPGRPPSIAEQFSEIVEPGSIAAGKGYGLFILQEGYWVFGEAGILLSMFCLGWCLEGIYLWFMRRMDRDIVALCYGCILGVCMASIRSGIVGQVKMSLMMIVPLLVLGYLPAAPFRRVWRALRCGPATDAKGGPLL